MSVLPDILAPGLAVVFCGMAASSRSAAAGAYYAGPGNRFWEILYRVGLTPRQLDPAEFRAVLGHGLGLTDMVKSMSGSDVDLPSTACDPGGLERRIRAVAPRVLAFNGKRAAQVFLRSTAVSYGPQDVRLGGTTLFVLPSTSGAARRYWNPAPWHALAGTVGRQATTDTGRTR